MDYTKLKDEELLPELREEHLQNRAAWEWELEILEELKLAKQLQSAATCNIEELHQEIQRRTQPSGNSNELHDQHVSLLKRNQ